MSFYLFRPLTLGERLSRARRWLRRHYFGIFG